MTQIVDRRIAELLCSRICHELVAGIAAINNGVELVSEIDSSMQDEAMGLIGSSARQSSVRVQFYRMAYGFAGNDALSGVAAVRELVDGLLESEARFTAELPDPAGAPALELGCGKLMLNLVVFAMDCLPRGGDLSVTLDDHDGRQRLSVVGQGSEARLSDRYRAAVAPDVATEDISALDVHAYYTAAVAAAIGRGLNLDVTNSSIALRVIL